MNKIAKRIINMNECNGCETLKKLWDKAMTNSAIDNPSSYGWFTRIFSPVESENIQWSMQLAALKCWEERTRINPNTSFPPIFETKTVINNINTRPKSGPNEVHNVSNN